MDLMSHKKALDDYNPLTDAFPGYDVPEMTGVRPLTARQPLSL